MLWHIPKGLNAPLHRHLFSCIHCCSLHKSQEINNLNVLQLTNGGPKKGTYTLWTSMQLWKTMKSGGEEIELEKTMLSAVTGLQKDEPTLFSLSGAANSQS